VQRVAVIVKLKPGAGERAAELVEEGPPFDLHEFGFERHTVYLADDEAVFVFEGPQAEAHVASATAELGPAVLRAWEPLVDGPPKFAQGVFSWTKDEAGASEVQSS
jgi:hypothetical protein